ncbi:MAG: glycine--tRNA ligase subunit beta [candidate division NC10 bacterium]|nr:glycine--tRNA ligase subunit beta [candidate division NC10 bacterium]
MPAPNRSQRQAQELLLEIGTEEIPSVFLPDAIRNLAGTAEHLLEDQRLRFQAVRTYATPRRLVLVVQALAAQQEQSRRKVVGPPRGVAFDTAGKPTKAAEGFARAQGVRVTELKIEPTDRGEYVVVELVDRGAPARDLLPTLIPRLITSLSFPKMMRWGNASVRFVRPIRWILCLYGGRVVPFEIDGIQSGAVTYGHRFLSPGPARIRDFATYQRMLERKQVIVDQARRREMVRDLAVRAAAKVGGKPVLEEDLVESVTHLVEFPNVVCGGFEREFLELPREVIITPMRKHQRYFPVVDEAGNLLPHFVAIANTRARDMGAIQAGNERVLRARLTDAAFYYKEDRKRPLPERVTALKQVIFQEKLGTLYDKTERVTALAGAMAAAVAPDLTEITKRAARLCKADLTTTMVKEFTELQGVMGREYARLAGEDPRVCQAIEEHYWPRFAGDKVPASKVGAFVALADRLDSIVGCFGIGLIPSGSEDPYALRRAATGVVQILWDAGLSLDCTPLIRTALQALGTRLGRKHAEVERDVGQFLAGRLLGLMGERGIPADVAAAVVPAEKPPADVPDAVRRAQALLDLKTSAEDFQQLTVTLKRVMNILPPDFAGRVDPARLKEQAERELHGAVARLRDEVTRLVAARDYLEALRRIATLRPVVDRFFTDVLVMVDDLVLRTNRLALLAETAALFSRIADFRQLTTP